MYGYGGEGDGFSMVDSGGGFRDSHVRLYRTSHELALELGPDRISDSESPHPSASRIRGEEFAAPTRTHPARRSSAERFFPAGS